MIYSRNKTKNIKKYKHVNFSVYCSKYAVKLFYAKECFNICSKAKNIGKFLTSRNKNVTNTYFDLFQVPPQSYYQQQIFQLQREKSTHLSIKTTHSTGHTRDTSHFTTIQITHIAESTTHANTKSDVTSTSGMNIQAHKQEAHCQCLVK